MPDPCGGMLAAAASRIYRAPYGLVFQDLVGQAAEQSGVTGGARVAGLVRSLELGLAKRAAAVAIITEGFRRYLQQGGVPPERICRLRNWTNRVEPIETAGETRRRFGWGPNDFVCLHGGNMGQKQGLDNLLDAADLLGGEGVRIALIGDGNDRARLERQARERGLANVEFIALQGPGEVGGDDAGVGRPAREPARLRDEYVPPVEAHLVLRRRTACDRRGLGRQ